MSINAFSNLTITVADGGTVPSLDYLPEKTYVDIGSGNILKVSWNTPTATDNIVDSYKLYILAYDSTNVSYKNFYVANVGCINEFYVPASLFESLQQAFIPIRIYVEAISRYGAAYNGLSNTASVNVSRGCGIYTSVEAGYKSPIMKRSLAFTKLAYVKLFDSNGKLVTDSAGNVVYGKASSSQDSSTGWALMQEFHAKDTSGKWHENDLKFEVLTDASGEVITDVNNETIYVL